MTGHFSALCATAIPTGSGHQPKTTQESKIPFQWAIHKEVDIGAVRICSRRRSSEFQFIRITFSGPDR
jgi:hypothetical protein